MRARVHTRPYPSTHQRRRRTETGEIEKVHRPPAAVARSDGELGADGVPAPRKNRRADVNFLRGQPALRRTRAGS